LAVKGLREEILFSKVLDFETLPSSRGFKKNSRAKKIQEHFHENPRKIQEQKRFKNIFIKIQGKFKSKRNSRTFQGSLATL